MSAKDPAFVLVTRPNYGWDIRGPDGMVWHTRRDRDEAEKLRAALDDAFDAGRAYERRKADAQHVPGPPNPPKPIHPRQVG